MAPKASTSKQLISNTSICKAITLLFYLSGIANIVGMAVVSRGFTSTVFFKEYPEVFSMQGCIGVMLWGLAYMAVASSFQRLPSLCLVFALEKAFYTWTWFAYMQRRHAVMVLVFNKDPLVGMFYYLYGINDAFFCVVFLVAYWFARAPQNSQQDNSSSNSSNSNKAVKAE
jgi:hypothetical protein